MKVLAQARSDFFTKPGGDTVQLQKSIKYLLEIGVKVDISTDIHCKSDKYDLIWLFNLDRPLETYMQLINAKENGKKTILSSIHHPHSYIELHERYARRGLIKLFNRIIPGMDNRELIKNIWRIAQYKLDSSVLKTQLVHSYFEQQKFVVNNVNAVIALSNGEKSSIEKYLDTKLDNCYIIPNGVDFTLSPLNNYDKKGVLSIGRIESRKNQISLIKALKDDNIELTFVGKVNPNHKAYTKDFLKAVASRKNTTFIPGLSHKDVLSLAGKFKVHALVSWFEVLPLVDFEAAVAGCNIVTTKAGYSKDYFADNAYYVEPSSMEDIRENILLAMERENKPDLANYIKYNFTWNKVALKLKQAFEEIL